MQNVVHNWGDTECVKILRNCKESVAENGKVIIVEHVLMEIPGSGVTVIQCADGGPYSRGEGEDRNGISHLGKASGFRCVFSSWFIELYNLSVQFLKKKEFFNE